MGYGGPHAAYFSTFEKYKRSIPGRIIGVSKGSKLWNPRHEPKTPTYYHMAALRSRFPFQVKHHSWLDYIPNGVIHETLSVRM